VLVATGAPTPAEVMGTTKICEAPSMRSHQSTPLVWGMTSMPSRAALVPRLMVPVDPTDVTAPLLSANRW